MAKLADRPPPAAQQVQHYALVHPKVFAALQPGAQLSSWQQQLTQAVYSSLAAGAQQPLGSAGWGSVGGGVASHKAAAGRALHPKSGGSASSAAARSRLNALLEG